MIHVKVVERKKKYILYPINFIQKSRRLWDRLVWEIVYTGVGNSVERGRPQMKILRLRVVCRIPKGYKHTLRICNVYSLSTATMVTRTHLNDTSYAHSPVMLYCILYLTHFNILRFICHAKNHGVGDNVWNIGM